MAFTVCRLHWLMDSHKEPAASADLTIGNPSPPVGAFTYSATILFFYSKGLNKLLQSSFRLSALNLKVIHGTGAASLSVTISGYFHPDKSTAEGPVIADDTGFSAKFARRLAEGMTL